MKSNGRYVISASGISVLEELMEADYAESGVCYQDAKGEYMDNKKTDLMELRELGMITEYTSSAKLANEKMITLKGWTITYHGIAFLYAYHTAKGKI